MLAGARPRRTTHVEMSVLSTIQSGHDLARRKDKPSALLRREDHRIQARGGEADAKECGVRARGARAAPPRPTRDALVVQTRIGEDASAGTYLLIHRDA